MSNEFLHILLAAKLTVVGSSLVGLNAAAGQAPSSQQSEARSYEAVATCPAVVDRAERGLGNGGGQVDC